MEVEKGLSSVSVMETTTESYVDDVVEEEWTGESESYSNIIGSNVGSHSLAENEEMAVELEEESSGSGLGTYDWTGQSDSDSDIITLSKFVMGLKGLLEKSGQAEVDAQSKGQGQECIGDRFVLNSDSSVKRRRTPLTTSSQQNEEIPLIDLDLDVNDVSSALGIDTNDEHGISALEVNRNDEPGTSGIIIVSVSSIATANQESSGYGIGPNRQSDLKRQYGIMKEARVLLKRPTITSLSQKILSGSSGRLKPMKQNHNCKYCGKSFGSKQSKVRHEGVHTGERPFSCSLCDRPFKQKYYLKAHMRTHTLPKQKPFGCTFCKKSYASKWYLKTHVDRIHRIMGLKPSASEEASANEESSGSGSSTHLDGPEMTRKEAQPVPEPPRPKLLSMGLKSDSLKQSKVKERKCRHCEKICRSPSERLIHERVHTGERPFSCSVCGKRYRSQTNLTVHMRSHSNERAYVCTFCGLAFRRKDHMTSHVIRKHTE